MTQKPDEITGQWRIALVRKLAQGGMGAVYEGILAGADGFEKRVAVKTLLDRFTRDARFMELFVAEAKLVSDLVHENIVQIYQLGRREDGGYYIVMELVEGLPLRAFLDRHIQQRRRIPGPLAVHIASRIARGLAYAHSFHDRAGRRLNIVHRDVCPANILLTTEGLAKLTDFGIANALAMPKFGERWLAGKIRYMAPEQAARQAVDFRADQYALGATLFELLSQTPVRPDDSDPRREDFTAIAVPWDRLPEGTDDGVIETLRRALDPDPARRYPDTNEMARALEYCIYRDGYGPTIQTVEAYLRRYFPDLYLRSPAGAGTDAPLAETIMDER